MGLGIANSSWVRELAQALCQRDGVTYDGNHRIKAEFSAGKLLEAHAYAAPEPVTDEADAILARWAKAEAERRAVAHERALAREAALEARRRADDPPDGHVFVTVRDEATGKRSRLTLPAANVQPA